MQPHLHQKAYDTLPSHFFVYVEENLGFGRYIIVDRLTNLMCRIEGAAPAFEVGQELEIQKGASSFGRFALASLKALVGIGDPLKGMKIMDMRSENVSQIVFSPCGDALEFAEACWNARKHWHCYRQ
jgi:hypothetical protein